MTWPSPQDYNEAIQNPSLSFDDPELKGGQPELDRFGLPRPSTGGFASVYKMQCGGRNWAVRCFLRHVTDQAARYSALNDAIVAGQIPHAVSFKFLEKGILVRDRWLPILKMEWVEGSTLNAFVERRLYDTAQIDALCCKFANLVSALSMKSIAHGDLQHGNIMVVNQELKLVDYDAMYVPSLTGFLSSELGHRNYQHPGRQEHHFGPFLDNFSSWVIYASLRALTIDPTLWHTLAGGDECLLFRHVDFVAPLTSRTFSTLEHHDSQEIRQLAYGIRYLLTLSPEAIPSMGTALELPDGLPEVPRLEDLPPPPDPQEWLSSWVEEEQPMVMDISSGSTDGGSSSSTASTAARAAAASSYKSTIFDDPSSKAKNIKLVSSPLQAGQSLPVVIRNSQPEYEDDTKAPVSHLTLTLQNVPPHEPKSVPHGWRESPSLMDHFVKVVLAGVLAFFIIGMCSYSYYYFCVSKSNPSAGAFTPVGPAPEAQTPDEAQPPVSTADQQYEDAMGVWRRGQFAEAAVSFDQLFEAAQSAADKARMADCSTMLGLCMEAQNRLADAEQHFQRSLDLNGELYPATALGCDLLHLGRIQAEQGKWKSAEKTLELAVDALGKQGMEESVAQTSALYLLEETYMKLGKPAKASVIRKRILDLLTSRR